MIIAVAPPAEAQDFLAVHPDTQFVDIIFTGLSGTARGKRIGRMNWRRSMTQGGRCRCRSWSPM